MCLITAALKHPRDAGHQECIVRLLIFCNINRSYPHRKGVGRCAPLSFAKKESFSVSVDSLLFDSST